MRVKKKMKILAFGDVHEHETALKSIEKRAEQADLLICAGDLSDFGARTKKVVDRLAKLKKPLLIIHGNHEGEQNMREACKSHSNITFLHKSFYRLDRSIFWGYGGGGFAFENPDFERSFKEFLKEVKKGDTVVVITHGPPYGTKLDFLPNLGHRGCKTMRKILDAYKPLLWVCGHLHENMGKTEVVGKTLLANPGADGRLLKL